MSRQAVVAMVMLALAWSGVASAEWPADPWSSPVYAPTTTITASALDGNVGGLGGLGKRTGDRWHKNTRGPCEIVFDVGSEITIGYARWFTLSGSNLNTGAYVYHLEYWIADANYANGGYWEEIPGTYDDTTTRTIGKEIFFDAVTTSKLKWVFGADMVVNPDTGSLGDNFRTYKFEFYAQSPAIDNLANRSGASLFWSNANGSTTIDLLALDGTDGNGKPHNGRGNPADGDPSFPRFEGSIGGQQYVTLMLEEAMDIQHVRLIAEDPGQTIAQFRIQYLAEGKSGESDDDWIVVPGYDFGEFDKYNVSDYALNIPTATMGLRLDMASPSTNSGDNRLRLWAFEAFGSPVPEPATMVLLAMGGLALLRRRK